MTVKELKELLSKFDDDATVVLVNVYYDRDGYAETEYQTDLDYRDVYGVTVDAAGKVKRLRKSETANAVVIG